ncbi:MAG TPA: DegT/DnrJ/EryC1/StrS family aminotransferase [Verrucomicrobiota bacterium]|nr:erythromycin biosynthesis sensory transduction protein eryC1 [Verrucomicrobiales bacterium]HRI12697.1 DegT/DnrJ/EryC1/StrS family aminotransferase [Verrucomicrobiota bacterium]
MSTKIPFLDLAAHHDPLRPALEAAVREVLDTSAFAGGPFVAHFEEEFSAFCGARHTIGVGSGTEALWFCLLALGVGPGDEVITVPHTFMATAEAITYCGARPVFVDVDPKYLTMDAGQVESAITPRTKAIIPVHLFGHPADMDAILAVARKHGLPVVEDACQAHGAEYKGRKAGTLGVAGCFSFYPGKNLGALGEAGAVTTQDSELCRKIQTLRDHGQPKKYYHTMIGWNGRMDGIQGAMLRVKLKHLARWNTQRRSHARLYDELLTGSSITIPSEASYARHVYHLYPVRIPNRDAVLRMMGERGIACGVHYPVPVHLQEAYRDLGHGPGSFPVCECAARESLSLPMYPELSRSQIESVAATLLSVASAAREHESVA